MIDLELGWRRMTWEAELPPLQRQDWLFTPVNLRLWEIRRGRSSPGLDVSYWRHWRLRRVYSLALEDQAFLQACLGHCHEALRQHFAELPAAIDHNPTVSDDPERWLRLPFSSRAYPEASPEHRAESRRRYLDLMRAHRYWLHLDLTSFYPLLDYRRPVFALRRLGLPDADTQRLLALFRSVATTRRQGLPMLGRAHFLLTRLYLQPVLQRALTWGVPFFLADLDEWNFFLPDERTGHDLLERLDRALLDFGLAMNSQKVWLVPTRRALVEQRTVHRFRWAYARHRLATAAARRGLDTSRWLLPEGDRWELLFMRPGLAEIAGWKIGQRAVRRWLEETTGAGERATILMQLYYCGLRPQAELRRYLEGLGGPPLVRDWAEAISVPSRRSETTLGR